VLDRLKPIRIPLHHVIELDLGHECVAPFSP
jgi:hypothetical protein